MSFDKWTNEPKMRTTDFCPIPSNQSGTLIRAASAFCLVAKENRCGRRFTTTLRASVAFSVFSIGRLLPTEQSRHEHPPLTFLSLPESLRANRKMQRTLLRSQRPTHVASRERCEATPARNAFVLFA